MDSTIKRLFILSPDTMNLPDKYLWNSIYLLFGKDTVNHTHLIFDDNRNFDFRDDSDYIVKSGNVLEYKGEYEFYKKRTIFKSKSGLKFIDSKTGCSFEDSLKNKWKLSIRSEFQKEGRFNKPDKEKSIFQIFPDGITLNLRYNYSGFICFNVKNNSTFKLDDINFYVPIERYI